jgi:hypothetical protein
MQLRAGFAGPEFFVSQSPENFTRLMNTTTALALLTGFSTAILALGQGPGPAPDAGANGPWNNDVLVYRTGAGGSVEKLATFERAGVPTVARLKDGRLIAAHQHFPENDRESFDKVAVHFSSDEGRTWTGPKVITVNGLPEGMRFPFDPTLVPLPDGRMRLYFTGNFLRQAGSTPAIHSAISTDGLTYTYEPGVRFAVAGRAVIDCAVALHDGVFHLFAPDNGAGPNPGAPRDNRSAADRPRDGVAYHATSKDGLNFTRVADVTATGNNRWLGGAQSDGGKLVFFGTGPGPWPLASSDGSTWSAASRTWRIPGADPGAVKLKDGLWLMVLTGPPVRRVSPSGMAMGGPGGEGFRPIPPIMAALDVNRDGVIDEDELGNAPAALRRLDRNGDRKLSPAELLPGPVPENAGQPRPTFNP